MTRYEIQRERSAVQVFARSTLRPFRGAAPVSGYVDAATRGDRLDLTQACGGVLRLQIDELRGDVMHLDRELRSRMNSDRYPAVTAVLQEVTAAGGGNYRMTGALTLHGRTQRVTGEASVGLEDPALLTLRGRLQLDIRDFGLVPPKLLMLKVHPEIEVHLELVAAAATAATA